MYTAVVCIFHKGVSNMHNFFEGLMEFHFLQNALVSAVVIGAVAGILGCFIILRGMSLMGDAISHAVLPGVALSFILGINFFIGALVFGLLASFLIAFVNQNSTIKGDTAIGITFSSFLALGVILIGVAKSSTDLFHILFGNILAVQDIDLLITLVVSVIVVVVILAYFKELQVTSFDPVFAQSTGMNVQFYHYLLLIDVPISTSSHYGNAKCRDSHDCGTTNYPCSNSVFIFKSSENNAYFSRNIWLIIIYIRIVYWIYV